MKSTFLASALSLGVTALVSLSIPSTVFAGPFKHYRSSHVVIKHNKRVIHRPRVLRHRSRAVVHRSPVVVVNPNRSRHFRNVYIVRPYGNFYKGYGWYKSDNDAYKWLVFTSITLKILDNLNEEQQRSHEAAQVKATSAKVGEAITWSKQNASGSVKVTRVGTSVSGSHCREFQQSVKIGGTTEQAYGAACLKADGSWEMVSTS